ncbi:hypothetical protein [Pedosphaera parvula]|uniref:Peptidase S8/S53 domain-containing protein n=1 Tax=Pedosphaera parvula (strain Ellin514) TaxID=320771 RepID=B9XRE6_PEDPL|nr:hypothetical protein [Pedosphaera parvula]EEF57580.1 hypothetical protein Cflav_PD0671 [Pedosphaera parvula Ellin514]
MSKNIFKWRPVVLVLIFAFSGHTTYASSIMDTIGVTLLRQTTTNLNGAGIKVAQVEANAGGSPPGFEVNPGNVSQPASLFTYYSTVGTANTYPNSVGLNSGHADAVGGYIYGLGGPIATNVAHVDNYDAEYFYTSIIAVTFPPPINARIVNQSYSFGVQTSAEQQQTDANFDDYAAQYNTLFVSAVANGGAVTAPGTSYNGIGVGAYQGLSSVGPTTDNGRAKPDITAPEQVTSYSTAEVTGCALLLLQAALRGDGGSDTNSAADIRVLKALLMNGAIKPVDWTNSSSSPLDARYGAGVLNIFNSYHQLLGGKNGFNATSTVSAGNPHPPTGAAGTQAILSGWDFNTSSGSPVNDSVNHYYFNLTNSAGNAIFTATATLVWNKQANATSINNLDLFLYSVNSGGLIAASTSAVDNVEHLLLTKLPPGRYDLQVLKHAGITPSLNETYSLAFEFFTMPLKSGCSNNTAVLSWPIYPTGFVLESASSWGAPISWSTVNVAPTVVNNTNRVVVSSSSGNQFFRLRRP